MKHVKIISLLLIAFIAISCNPYRKITFSNVDFYKKKRVAENIDRYDVLVHDKDSVYVLKNAALENNTISGNLESIESTPESQDEKVDPNEKNDIHLYLAPETKISDVSAGEKVELTESNIEKAEMYAKDDDGVAGVFWTIFIIVGAVILTIVLVLVLAISSANSSGDGNISSGDSSSGDSNSDGGGGGGGGGGSSCYVATMAYGSQDANQVVLLRQFRDRFLIKFGLGRAFITWYYKNSPAFVAKHESKTWLHTSIRILLNGFVGLLRPFLRK